MTDKEILISDLNDISEILNNNGYGGWCATILKAVTMLKEQEAKNVVNMTLSKNYSLIASCPKCNVLLTRVEHKNYCGYCGQAVKWE